MKLSKSQKYIKFANEFLGLSSELWILELWSASQYSRVNLNFTYLPY
jgi:hypothetical protein